MQPDGPRTATGVPRLSGVHFWTDPDPTPLADLPDVISDWTSKAPGMKPELTGVVSVSRLQQDLATVVASCLLRTLETTGTSPEECELLILATSDSTVAELPADLGRTLVTDAGLSRCVPMLVTWQQCCSLIAALSTAAAEVRGGRALKVLVVGLDFTVRDDDRLHSFGVFGDAVCSALVSAGSAGLEIVEGVVCADPAGMAGKDSFASRQKSLTRCLAAIGYESTESKKQIDAIFPTNTFAPLVTFTAAAGGLPRDRLRYQGALRQWGHCGVADPLVNLALWEQNSPPVDCSVELLLLGTAPGFYGALRLRKEARA